MDFELDDTIAALSSPPGPGARGIIRVSGPHVLKILSGSFVPEEAQSLAEIKRAERLSGKIELDPHSGVTVPCSVYYWPTSRSYTGQPSAEFQFPGSPPLLEAALGRFYQTGARPARPGEFTLRSFLAGRVDLVQAEAVLGVIDAHDETELTTALKQLAGGLSGRLKKLREEMIELVADMEAGLDFVEEDIEFISREEIVKRLHQALDLVEEILEQSESRMTSHSHPRVVLAGLPNAGKSTLFNALVGEDQALVSQVAGTTRDYLSQLLEWGGMTCELIDTAGWEADEHGVMEQAHKYRDELLQEADLVVWCLAANSDPAPSLTALEMFNNQIRKQIVIQTKSDLPIWESGHESFSGAVIAAQISVTKKECLEELKSQMIAALSERGSHEHQFLGTTAARSRQSLVETRRSLQHAIEAAESNWGDEMIAIDLHEAVSHLGEILGEVYNDDLLGRIFSKFCIGK